ncbi:Crp/Fnr family transcriptional regulator [Virgibacillus profundi]|uniref:Crp/Fnr family transcriptional regulator n=1 Tax=Virgibacillus profundi TaxID=2024555 RepID=A0A2A2II76_9BACI|nr:Crp/Fnr family transcriptional regulator [Virgibacillus profundi]PAV30815.1 Crp/Fnr family transcriptional regulator [Virgibacillus profundi]PXY54998.1 Crp/Fnr family transcriptional regulator [Virgibacillus profundi]
MQLSSIGNDQNGEAISEDFRDLLYTIGNQKKVEKDSFIFHEGMDAHEIYLIKSGIIHISKLSSDGKELSLRICTSNDIIGELTLFTDNPKYFLSSRVIKSGEVLAINKETLEKELMNNGPLAIEAMKWTSNHMRKFQSKIRDLLLNGKKGALYSTLIRFSNSFGVNQTNGILIDMPLTNQELAKFCSCTRESVNRMLGDLRKLDIIEMQPSKKILIKDLEYLKKENGCENCPIEICNIC